VDKEVHVKRARIRVLTVAVGALSLLTLGTAPPAAAQDLHPCHEYWPDGGHLVKWAEYEGVAFASCMAAEFLK
jgi:hypothetical protein